MKQNELKTRILIICFMLFLPAFLMGQATGSTCLEIDLGDMDDNGRVDIIDYQILIQKNADSIYAIEDRNMYQSMLKKARAKWNKLNLDYYDKEPWNTLNT
jgi:hypothetical protein